MINMLNSVFVCLLVLSSGCSVSLIKKPAIQPVKQPPPKVVDLNNDGVITSEEVQIATDTPEPLSVFTWLVVAVLLTVIITMIFSRIKDKNSKTTTGPSPIYRTKNKQQDVIRG